jgi:uncharacterized protein (TIGR00251 family)
MSAEPHADAVLHVRVKPRARRAGILGRHGAGIKAAVRAAPERGRANDELIEVLAKALGIARSDAEIVAGKALGIARSDAEIVAGASSQDKKVRVRLSAEVLEQRLRSALGETD